jgi:hypothetical protein
MAAEECAFQDVSMNAISAVRHDFYQAGKGAGEHGGRDKKCSLMYAFFDGMAPPSQPISRRHRTTKSRENQFPSNIFATRPEDPAQSTIFPRDATGQRQPEAQPGNMEISFRAEPENIPIVMKTETKSGCFRTWFFLLPCQRHHYAKYLITPIFITYYKSDTLHDIFLRLFSCALFKKRIPISIDRFPRMPLP